MNFRESRTSLLTDPLIISLMVIRRCSHSLVSNGFCRADDKQGVSGVCSENNNRQDDSSH